MSSFICATTRLLGIILNLSWLATAAEGDWPMWRHDTQLSGYQPLPGVMTSAPRVLAKYSIGAGAGVQTMADLRGTGQSNEVLVVARARVFAYTSEGMPLWTSAPTGYVINRIEWVADLDGDGFNEVVASAGHMGGPLQAFLILDGRTGKLRGAIEFNGGDFGQQTSLGAYVAGERGKQIFIVTSLRQLEAKDPSYTPDIDGPHDSGTYANNGEFSLWSFDGRKVRRLWGWSPKEYVVEYPVMFTADLAGDGRMRGVVSDWCHVWNIDLSTGKAVSHTTWDPEDANHRHYGFNRLIDVDGDGKLDYVNLAGTKHVDVLRNVGGKFELAWTHGWADSVTTSLRTLQYPSEPVLDVDGDGKLEIVASLFDGKVDQRWHLYVWDAATGKQKAEIPDVVPLMCAPLWGEKGGQALLCVRATNINFRSPKTYEVWRLREEQVKKVWESTTASFVTVGGNGVKAGDVDGDSQPEFFTAAQPGGAEQAWGVDREGMIVAKAGKALPPPAPPPVASAKPALTPPQLPPLDGMMVPHLLAADLDGSGRNKLLLYNNSTVTVLGLEQGELRQLEAFPSTEIPIVCNLLGDGKPYLLTSGREADGNIWVQARGPDRQPLWRYLLPNTASSSQYASRAVNFTVGHFTGGAQLDVFLYCAKPGARTDVLNGRTGKRVWERDEVPNTFRHFQPAGGRASVWDYNGDGADDILFLNPDFYCVADGKSGELLVGPVGITKLIKWWAAYSSPAVLAGRGSKPLVYLGGAYACTTTISLDGQRCFWHDHLRSERWRLNPLWREGFVEGLLPPARGNAGGKNHGWRVGNIEADGTFRCFEARTGRTRWQLAMPTAISSITTGDVDGDGQPDFVLSGYDGRLLVVSDGGKRAKPLWSLQFDAPAGPALLADLNRDGRSELVVSVGDGNIYVLGK